MTPTRSPGTSVSAASATAVDEVASLAARTFPLACPPDLDPDVIATFIRENLTADAFRVHLATDGHDVLCARTDDGTLIGYALLVAGTEMDPACDEQILARPTIGISKFYVDPDHHGSGTSSTLLTAIEELAHVRGARSLWLATNVGNERARRFYARNGFAERGGRTFVVGGVPNADVVYEKPLPA